MSLEAGVHAEYMGNDEPNLKGYYPKWVDNLADDVTLEGSLLDGAVQGAKAVRSIVIGIRELYDQQLHKFAGDYADNRFIEEYVATIRGVPIGCMVLVRRNAAGKAQHIMVGYRPRSSVMLLSRLLREKFAGAPFAGVFADDAEE
jgi:hypothetical protein